MKIKTDNYHNFWITKFSKKKNVKLGDNNMTLIGAKDKCPVTSKDLKQEEITMETLVLLPSNWTTTPKDSKNYYLYRFSLDGLDNLSECIKDIPSKVKPGETFGIKGKSGNTIQIGYRNKYERVCPVCKSLINIEDTICSITSKKFVCHSECLRKISDIIEEITNKTEITLLKI